MFCSARPVFAGSLFTSAVAVAATAALSLLPDAVRACSSCGCSLGTDWSDAGLTTASGFKLDLRYDFVNQNQLRYGRAPVATDGLSTDQIDTEIQQGTLTDFYTLSADYAFNPDWGINVQLPYLVRLHQTIAEGDDPVATLSDYRGIGDLRVVGRYQGFLSDRSLGVQFGLKFPTGPFHASFAAGPEAGELVDRGLQTGTGTTDIIVGIYQYGPLGHDWDHFEQLQFKEAIDSKEQFRPSPQFNVNLGIRYVANPVFVPQLQINTKWEGRELGEQADYPNSGSRVVDLSPGATVRITSPLHAYAFVQLPIYQDYNGYQLAPRYTASVGLGYRF